MKRGVNFDRWVCLGLAGTLGPSVFGVAQGSDHNEEEDRPWLEGRRLG